MSRKRPTAITVVAILQLVFGGLGLMAGLCGAGGLALGLDRGMKFPQPDPKAAAQQERLEKLQRDHEPPYNRAYQTAQVALSLVCAGLLITSGIGLLKMQLWARWTSIVYALLSILNTGAGVVRYVLVDRPMAKAMLSELEREMGNKQEGKILVAAMEVGMMGGMAVAIAGLALPITVLVFMFLPTVVAALRRTGRDEDDTFDEAGADDDEWPRRRADLES